MTRASFANRWNLDAVESQYALWRDDPSSVDEAWRLFFEGFELGLARPSEQSPDGTAQNGVSRLIRAYRDFGHFLAHLDPLNPPRASYPALELEAYSLTEADLDKTFEISACPAIDRPRATLRELIAALRETYCRTIGVEYTHILDANIRTWLIQRMESVRNHPGFPHDKKVQVLHDLHQTELFEKFLHTRFSGEKRFSLEGAETLIPMLDALVHKASTLGVREIIIGMAHRGRLNVLANIMGKPYYDIFAEFSEHYSQEGPPGDSDVKYHLGFSCDRQTPNGSVHLSLTPNPSHLEAVNPVVEGRTRAKQAWFHDTDRRRGLPLLIHGDAAFAGQGLVAETLNLSQLRGYTTGGTIHVIVNNQIGFTTSPVDARSTVYCSDVAKMIEAPIFHVNGEDPESCVYVMELALEFRQKFGKDVVIDMYCYRRWGHNETDEPSFTQPLMYSKIRERPTVVSVYTQQLIQRGDMTAEETRALDEAIQAKLSGSLQQVKSGAPVPAGMRGFAGHWERLTPVFSFQPVETGVPLQTLAQITDTITRVPDGFSLHPKSATLNEARKQELKNKQSINWGFAEQLAYGSLLLEGTPVRLSGQDCRRGTFTHRHAVWIDTKTGKDYYPLQHLAPNQAPFAVYDSLLSEAAVLGFEFGYSLDDPQTLVLWEAQFGDFANGAQVIIDQFVVSSASKWQRDSGLVMLLPHGYEGQGPEHSSARLERFLQMCAENNIQVCNLTTPAQFFHVLRRQVKRNFRKPLIIMTPKGLLRHNKAVSSFDELVSGQFQEIIDDTTVDPERVRRVVLCSGKVYYDLLERRTAEEITDVAMIRVEQLYPLNEQRIEKILTRFRKARERVWAQEESQNMGAWSFIEPRLRALGFPVEYVGRDASASPANGSKKVHVREQEELVNAALTGPIPHLVRASCAFTKKPNRPTETQVKQSAGTPTA